MQELQYLFRSRHPDIHRKKTLGSVTGALLMILIMALLVFIIVQLICDMVVTPKVMGKAMGLNPAILLLSLSVWGALLGFIGLIIALPLTTLLIAYYQRYVTKEGEVEEVEEGTPPD